MILRTSLIAMALYFMSNGTFVQEVCIQEALK